jgi:serine protease
MRIRALLGAGVGTALFLLAVSVGDSTATAAAPQPQPIHQINLAAPYRASLPKETPQPKAIHYPRGHVPKGGSGPGGICSEPACPLPYNGGSVQHSPKVYLLLWGSSWSGAGSDTLYLQNFLAGLGVQASDTWSTSMDQYTDSTGHPSFSGSVLQGTWQDPSTPPLGATQTQLAAEADAFYFNQGLTDRVNAQVMIATPSGTCPENFYAPSCSNGSGQYCAWHSYTNNSVPYTNLPYLLDAGASCGQGTVNLPGTYDGFSIVGGHEYGETVTDPYVHTGWWDSSDLGGGENGDKCAWTNTANVTFSTGTFAMQPLWSNSAHGCAMSTVITSYQLSVSKSGTGTGTVTSSPTGINCGTTCTALYGSGTPVTLTEAPAPGSTFAGWSGACSGSSTTCSVTMSSAKSVSATFSTSPGTRYEETAAQYQGWVVSSDPTANGGAWRTSAVTNDTAAFAFSGSGMTWLSNKGPSRGIAAVSIDGVSKGSVDLYSAAPAGYSKAFTGLVSRAHTMVVKVTGSKNAASSGTGVVVDGFQVGTTTTQESANAVKYNTWKGSTSVNASGGTYRASGTAGAFAQLTFSGTNVSWITAVGSGWGKAEVYIDGVDKGSVDLYAATGHWQTPKTYGGLSSGSHTIKVKVLGTKNVASTSTKVAIDSFIVS